MDEDQLGQELFQSHLDIPVVPILTSKDRLLVGFDEHKMLDILQLSTNDASNSREQASL